MVETSVSSEDLVAAYGRTRSHWKRLVDGVPDASSERELFMHDLAEDMQVIAASARVSEETLPFVEIAFRIRLWEPQGYGDDLPQEISQAADSLHTGFGTLVRSLQQMENADDILPESARDMRKSAARTMTFFHELSRLKGAERDDAGPPASGSAGARLNAGPVSTLDATGWEKFSGETRAGEDREAVIQRLAQSYDVRRKHVSEDMQVPPPAIEAIEFLLRLGGG